MRYPHAYRIGQTVRFIPIAANSSTFVSVKIGTLAATPVADSKIANGGSATVPIGQLQTDRVVTLTYSQTPDTLTKYWRVQRISPIELDPVPLSKLAAGSANITAENKNLLMRCVKLGMNPALLNIRLTDGDFDTIVDVDGQAIRCSKGSNNSTVITPEYIEYAATNTTSRKSRRMCIRLEASAADWSNSATDGWYTWDAAGTIDLPGVSPRMRLISASVNFKGSDGLFYCGPVMVKAETYITDYYIKTMKAATFLSPASSLGTVIVELEFDPSRTYDP
jgi:hypothetical protein